MSRRLITTGFLLLLTILLAALIAPQYLDQVADEMLWRSQPTPPTLASLNEYLKNCTACFQRRQVSDALTRAAASSGLLANFDLFYPYGRSTANPDRWQVRGQATQGAISPGGERAITVGNGLGSAWEIATAKRPFLFTPYPMNTSYKVTEDDRNNRLEEAVFLTEDTLASISAVGRVAIWNGLAGERLRTFETGVRNPSNLAAAPSGKWIAFVNGSEEASVVDTASGNVTSHEHKDVQFAAFPSADSLVTVSSDRIVWWRPGFEVPQRSIPLAPNGFVNGLSADGNYILLHARRTAEVWSTEDGKPVAVLEEGAQSELTASCSPGRNSFLVTGTEDGFLHLWNLETAKQIASYPAHATHVDRLACHGASKRVLSIGQHFAEAKVWSMEAFGKEVAPALRGQSVTGRMRAAQLGADLHLLDLAPGFLLDFRDQTPLLFAALAVTAMAFVWWLRSKPRSRKRRR